MNLSNVAVVVLNYNGKKFLEKFLPPLITHSGKAQIIVADNASSDDSVDFIKKNYSNVSVIQNVSNLGYAGGYNEVLKKIRADYFVLINNDVEVSEGWIDPVIELMKADTGISAVQPKLLSYYHKDEFEYAGAGGGFIDENGYPFCRGRIFHHLEKDHSQYNDIKEIFWASGACLFVRASAFEEVKGFDADYFAHMEEIDLCWRMKNLGGKIYYCGKSTVYHVGGGTLHKISARKTFLNFRNNLITFTKNRKSGKLFFHVIWRLILDGVAAMKFLAQGSISHFFAVIKAHFSFYAMLRSTLRKRSSMRREKKFREASSAIYGSSIVKAHFIEGKKLFSDLDHRRFNH